jgi:hypothetical protein
MGLLFFKKWGLCRRHQHSVPNYLTSAAFPGKGAKKKKMGLLFSKPEDGAPY